MEDGFVGPHFLRGSETSCIILLNLIPPSACLEAVQKMVNLECLCLIFSRGHSPFFAIPEHVALALTTAPQQGHGGPDTKQVLNHRR